MLAVLMGGLALDLTSKHLAFEHVAWEPVRPTRAELLADPDWAPPPHSPVIVLPWRLLDFQLVINRGAVFGIAANQRFFFIGFTGTALVVGFFIFGRFTKSGQRLAHVAIGLVLAGGMGNLYDRMTLGAVRDFLHMLPGRHLPYGWHWPGGSPELFPWVFNIADMLLLFGMAMLMVHMSRMDKRRRAASVDLADAASQTSSND